MNAVNAKLLTSVATMLTLSLLCIEHPALAQSNCKDVKGTVDEVFFLGGNSGSGTLSNAGWLNGTTLAVFTGPPSSPLPNIAVFASQYTITTSQGQLKTSNVYLLDVATLKGNILGNIEPNGSTGIFAGATGTLFLNTTKVNVAGNPQTFHSEVIGQVCFARQ